MIAALHLEPREPTRVVYQIPHADLPRRRNSAAGFLGFEGGPGVAALRTSFQRNPARVGLPEVNTRTE